MATFVGFCYWYRLYMAHVTLAVPELQLEIVTVNGEKLTKKPKEIRLSVTTRHDVIPPQHVISHNGSIWLMLSVHLV